MVYTLQTRTLKSGDKQRWEFLNLGVFSVSRRGLESGIDTNRGSGFWNSGSNGSWITLLFITSSSTLLFITSSSTLDYKNIDATLSSLLAPASAAI